MDHLCDVCSMQIVDGRNELYEKWLFRITAKKKKERRGHTNNSYINLDNKRSQTSPAQTRGVEGERDNGLGLGTGTIRISADFDVFGIIVLQGDPDHNPAVTSWQR